MNINIVAVTTPSALIPRATEYLKKEKSPIPKSRNLMLNYKYLYIFVKISMWFVFMDFNVCIQEYVFLFYHNIHSDSDNNKNIKFRCSIHLRYLVLVGGVLVCCVVLLNSAHKKLFGKFGGLLCVLRRDCARELPAPSSQPSQLGPHCPLSLIHHLRQSLQY